jgi:hypothetical protein
MRAWAAAWADRPGFALEWIPRHCRRAPVDALLQLFSNLKRWRLPDQHQPGYVDPARSAAGPAQASESRQGHGPVRRGHRQHLHGGQSPRQPDRPACLPCAVQGRLCGAVCQPLAKGIPAFTKAAARSPTARWIWDRWASAASRARESSLLRYSLAALAVRGISRLRLRFQLTPAPSS